MRNWPLLLASDLYQGKWFMELNHAFGMNQVLETVLDANKDSPLLGKEITEVRGALPIISLAEGSEVEMSYDQLPEGSIAIFKISGTMLKYGTYWSYGTEEIAEQMIIAARHKNISGCLIEGDSGGGGVSSIAPLLYAREFFRAEKKPIVGLFDYCYSAMYYFASSLDYIMAANNISSGFGSIGVEMTLLDIMPYFKKMGIVEHVITPPESSEKNAAVRLVLEGKYEKIINEQLSPLAIGFQNHVKATRSSKLQLEVDPLIIKGKIYNAEDSVENGLADAIGNKAKAIEMIFDRIQVNNFLKTK